MSENESFFWQSQLWASLSNDKTNSGVVLDHDMVTPAAASEQRPKPPSPSPPPAGRKRSRGVATSSKKRKEIMVADNEDEKKQVKNTSQCHDMHIWTERERRKKMRNMFSFLHTLLPHLPTKADKSTIIEEAVNQIKILQCSLQDLQKKKLDRLQGGTTANTLINDPIVAATSKLAMLSTRENFMADQVSAINNNNNNNNNNNSITTGARSSSLSCLLPAMIHTWTSSPNVVLNICGENAQFSVYAPKKAGLFTAICGVLEKYKLEIVSAHISSDAYRCTYIIQACLANGTSGEFLEIYKQAAGDIMLWVSS